MSSHRTARPEQIGTVVSDKMQKTIVVQVERLVRHPVYRRVIRRASSFKAHDERNEARRGDRVRIAETRPLSRDKRWRLVEILTRSTEPPPEVSAATGPELPVPPSGEQPEGRGTRGTQPGGSDATASGSP